MDRLREMGDRVMLEEIVDEGEVYEGVVIGENDETMYLEGEEIDVEELEAFDPGEYIQLPGGELIHANEHRARVHHQGSQPVQHQGRRSLQNENHAQSSSNPVYAIRDHQVYKLEKTSDGMINAVKYEKQDPDAPQPSSSSGRLEPRSQYNPVPFRRDTHGGFQPFNAPSLMPQVVNKPKRYVRKALVGHRKPCNCTKSMCLKLYCECFANGEFCRDCNCKDCHNNLQHESERSRAIRSSLERNPNAFKPKIVSGPTKGRTDAERVHMKGCHCKKSNCLKNYCECYEAKVACSDRCKCAGCKNTETDRATKFRERLGPTALLSLANVASLSGEGNATSGGQNYSDEESDNEPEEKVDPKTMPWYYVTDQVIEAATLCLVTTAEEVETRGNAADDVMERALMAEFANVLQGVISSATSAANVATASKKSLKKQRLLSAEGATNLSSKEASDELVDPHSPATPI